MAERDFYNINDYIIYPLVYGDNLEYGGTPLPRQGIVDAGFMMGIDSGFVAGVNNVRLNGFTITATDVIFDFRCDALGLLLYRWLFTIPLSASFGCVAYEDATPIVGGPGDRTRGWAYLNIGDISGYAALAQGAYLMDDPPRVEPALLQSLVDTYVRTVTIANDARRCPDTCSPSSSSSSSSSSSAAPGGDAFIAATGLVGDVKFKEGYNSQISLDTVANAVVFSAGLGLGEGQTCDDIIVDEEGTRPDNCQSCDGLIKSINGVPSPTGSLRLGGVTGMQIIALPAEHKLKIKIDVNRLCLISSSSSSSSG